MTPAAKKALDLLDRVLERIPRAEQREGQAEMVQHVADAIESGESLVIQAGTGTGKTLGYLIPVLAAGQTAVVATYTKALQDQLASVDLPLLTEVCDEDDDLAFTWAVLKGRNNYLCRQRVSEIETGHDQLALEDDGDVGGEDQIAVPVLVEEPEAIVGSDDVADFEGFHETSIPPAAAGFTWILAEVSRNRDASST